MTTILAIISASFPTSQNFKSREVAVIWFEMLKGYKYEDVSARLSEYIRANRFPPTISDLVPQQKPADLTGEWKDIIGIVAHYGYYRQAEALEAMTDAQRQAVKLIGYARICQSEPNALFREFTEVHKAICTEVMVV
jgi:hypothetical protein